MSEWKRDAGGNRFCDGCGHYHGPLYVCERYTAAQKAELQALGDQHRANLRDPAWLQQQRDAGVPESVLRIFRAFAGVE